MTKRAWWLAWAVLIVIVGLGAVLDVMEVDAAEYAGMSRDLLVSGDPLRLLLRGEDYIDKPYLLFWTSALSFKLFGVHNWSYKLPSILFAIAAVYATFRLARLFHAVEVARAAALLFASTAAFFLMNNDVRCDTLLTGSVITAIWLGAEYMERRRWKHLIGCAVAIGLGMLAKGPMGAMAPLLALGTPVLIQRRWAVLRDPRLLVAPLIVGLLLVPLCLGLWWQHGSYGLRFYFWEQSFGRITGESEWSDDSSIFYFTHEILWLLLPWTLFALIGLGRDIRTWIAKGARALPEIITLSGAITVFIALSFSRYKLPHYIYPILPLTCIIAARALLAERGKAVNIAQGTLLVLLFVPALALVTWSFPSVGFAALLIAALLGAAYALSRDRGPARMLWPTFIVMAATGIVINGHVYPNILRYQANAHAGKWMAAHPVPPGRFFGFSTGGHALDFYAGHYVPWYGDLDHVRSEIVPGTVVYADEERRQRLLDAGLHPLRVMAFERYSVQLIDLQFLDPAQRDSVVSPRYLLFY